jgi:enoyl-CoA hydratase/carnithine racemase
MRLDRDRGCAVIDICDPATLNGIHAGNLPLFPQLVAAAAEPADATYLVVRGTQRHFCTGGGSDFLEDLTALPPSTRQARLKEGQAWVLALLNAPLLTVAAVDGLAVGAGVDLMLAFDIVLFRPTAKVSFFYNRLGAIPDLGGLFLLAERIGASRALEFYAGSDVWSGDRAAQAGLGRLHREDFPTTAAEWRTWLARAFPIHRDAYAAAKGSLSAARQAGLAAHQAKVARAQAHIFGTAKFQARLKRVLSLQRLGGGQPR